MKIKILVILSGIFLFSCNFAPKFKKPFIPLPSNSTFKVFNATKNATSNINWEWWKQFKDPYWQPHEILARLTEETGELAREINHRWGPKKKKSTEDTRELGEEIGDIIFTLCCLANSQNIDLEESFKSVMEKHYGRDNNRYEKK